MVVSKKIWRMDLNMLTLLSLVFWAICFCLFGLIWLLFELYLKLETFVWRRKQKRTVKRYIRESTPWWKLKEYGGWI
jgi:uncharacterized protein HemY